MQSQQRISIAASTRKLDVDNRFPLKKYYRAADNLLRQANIYREEGNFIELYVLLIRFSSLVGETIPEHQDYRTLFSKERSVYKLKFRKVLLELEKLKPEVQILVDKLNNEISNAASSGNNVGRYNEWALASDSQKKLLNTEMNGLSQQTTMYQSREQPSNLSWKFYLPNKETLSKHSLLGPDGLRARWDLPAPQAKIEYPKQNFSTDVLSLEKSWNSILSGTDDSKESESEVPSDIKSADNLSEPMLIRQPSPPPTAAPVQSMSVMDDLMELFEGNDSLGHTEIESSPPLADSDSLKTGLSLFTENLKQTETPKELHIPAKMMEEFMKFARKNTSNSIETCGVLAGSLKNSKFYITALIIPKQQATSNTCQTTNEEEIFEWQDKHGLFQLGWIHTHPTQSCFMSSVDLHTHYSYQIMLPEAIAIVMAPTDKRKYGIFRLSDPGGIQTIQKCALRGFHAHDPPSDGKPIYETSTHVLLSESLKYEVADLR